MKYENLSPSVLKSFLLINLQSAAQHTGYLLLWLAGAAGFGFVAKKAFDDGGGAPVSGSLALTCLVFCLYHGVSASEDLRKIRRIRHCIKQQNQKSK